MKPEQTQVCWARGEDTLGVKMQPLQDGTKAGKSSVKSSSKRMAWWLRHWPRELRLPGPQLAHLESGHKQCPSLALHPDPLRGQRLLWAHPTHGTAEH